jgi:hypothetical protein
MIVCSGKGRWKINELGNGGGCIYARLTRHILLVIVSQGADDTERSQQQMEHIRGG